MKPLAGKIALVTGAARGMGRGSALVVGTVRDVGLAVAFLCGEGGRYITGSTIDVNGGLYLR